jgi:hypothetical protein
MSCSLSCRTRSLCLCSCVFPFLCLSVCLLLINHLACSSSSTGAGDAGKPEADTLRPIPLDGDDAGHRIRKFDLRRVTSAVNEAAAWRYRVETSTRPGGGGWGVEWDEATVNCILQSGNYSPHRRTSSQTHAAPGHGASGENFIPNIRRTSVLTAYCLHLPASACTCCLNFNSSVE